MYAVFITIAIPIAIGFIAVLIVNGIITQWDKEDKEKHNL